MRKKSQDQVRKFHRLVDGRQIPLVRHDSGKQFVRKFHRLVGERQSLDLSEQSAADAVYIMSALLDFGVSKGVSTILDKANHENDPNWEKEKNKRAVDAQRRNLVLLKSPVQEHRMCNINVRANESRSK